tara:strand:+ start:118 stop:282 length:165 start_codon:yes stop_codon:yes gene_type:complete
MEVEVQQLIIQVLAVVVVLQSQVDKVVQEHQVQELVVEVEMVVPEQLQLLQVHQ